MSTNINTKYLSAFMNEEELDNIAVQVKAAHDALTDGTGAGNDFIGWVDLPKAYDKEEFSRIKAAAKKIQGNSDVFVVIGIGGSYLGARAAIEFLKSPNYNALKKDTPDIYYTGNSISSTALAELLEICEGRDVSINMISKSGTTTEPAIAFRVVREMLEKKYGKEGAKERIFCTTDKAKGTLKKLADTEGYETFVVPDNVGGRYSVLTAVGLLPIAVSGADIDALMQGAANAMEELSNPDLKTNDCYKYAAIRNVLYAKGYTTDGIGFSDALKNAGIPIGDNVTVVGCGGVGRVFVNTCLAQGSKHVNILECRQALDNAKNFAQSINERYGSGTASVFETSQFDGESNLLINASPIGMYPQTEACAVEDNVILKADNVFDAVYNPSETLLVKKAKDMGKKAITGMTMLVYQAAAAQTIWNSVTFAPEDIKKLAEDCYKNIE